MSSPLPAKVLQLHFSESHRYQGKPLYEAILAKCRELQIAGATVFRGLEGYGATTEIHDRPVVMTIVDSAEKLASLIPVAEDMMDTGLWAMSDVNVIRVQKTA